MFNAPPVASRGTVTEVFALCPALGTIRSWDLAIFMLITVVSAQSGVTNITRISRLKQAKDSGMRVAGDVVSELLGIATVGVLREEHISEQHDRQDQSN